jgi:hypothetical protein
VVRGPGSSWPFPDTRAFAGSAPALTLSASHEGRGDQTCDPDRVQERFELDAPDISEGATGCP